MAWLPCTSLQVSFEKASVPTVQAPPVALRSVLEGEIRAFAAHQGVDGHRQCLRKFLELLLARGEPLSGPGYWELHQHA